MSEKKPIKLSQSVYEICKAYPQVKDILKAMGFQDIAKPGMLQTAGRFMTIPKGARMKNIPLESIKEKLVEQGFTPMEGENDE